MQYCAVNNNRTKSDTYGTLVWCTLIVQSVIISICLIYVY